MLKTRCPGSLSAARSFVQLSQQHSTHGCAVPALDFLLPSRQPRRCAIDEHRRPHDARPHDARQSRFCDGIFSADRGGSAWPSGTRRWADCSLSSMRSRRRLFSTTKPWRETHTIFHPQMDEDGNEMKLEISDRAAKVRSLPLPLLWGRRCSTLLTNTPCLASDSLRSWPKTPTPTWLCVSRSRAVAVTASNTS